MLSNQKIRLVTAETLTYWKGEVARPIFTGIAQGKEIGHKLADLVDEKTTALLTVNHLIRHEYSATGNKRARSMGDLWLEDGGIYHPVNVKTGIVGAEGQPNLVSMKKILDGITHRLIDSYYLLIVKISIRPKGIEPHVYFIDMLDWLDFLTFDSGPGQIMLKAKAFFVAYETRKVERLAVKEKLKTLMALYEDGERRLQENRAHDLKLYRKAAEAFLNADQYTVTPETQRSLHLR
jgi:hypothetical protein